MAKITLFRPDGQQSYDNVQVNSLENGIVNFTIEHKTNESVRQGFVTNLPYIIEHEE